MKLDEKKFPKPGRPTYVANYYVYYQPPKARMAKTEKDVKELCHQAKLGTACFSDLADSMTRLWRNKKVIPNRVVYLANFKKHNTAKYHLTEDLRKWWVTTCKKYGLLPKYAGKDYWKDGFCVVKTYYLNIQKLYAYLTAARNMQDEPYFIRAIHYLVETKNVDFFVAYTTASRLTLPTDIHHLVKYTTRYDPDENKMKNIEEIDVSWAFGLYKFISTHKTPKTVRNLFRKSSDHTNMGSFNFFDTMENIKPSKQYVSITDLDKCKVVGTL